MLYLRVTMKCLKCQKCIALVSTSSKYFSIALLRWRSEVGDYMVCVIYWREQEYSNMLGVEITGAKPNHFPRKVQILEANKTLFSSVSEQFQRCTYIQLTQNNWNKFLHIVWDKVLYNALQCGRIFLDWKLCWEWCGSCSGWRTGKIIGRLHNLLFWSNQ